MIIQIHKHGDYQTQDFEVGKNGVASIDRFNINGLHADWPRLRVRFENGSVLEMDEKEMFIKETP